MVGQRLKNMGFLSFGEQMGRGLFQLKVNHSLYNNLYVVLFRSVLVSFAEVKDLIRPISPFISYLLHQTKGTGASMRGWVVQDL